MSSSLYDADTLVWSEQQAALLRRLAAGERVNEAVDWENVIEEIEDVGRAQISGFQSLLRQALVHLLRIHGDPAGPVTHWRSETIGFLSDARDRFAPSMRQRIDLAKLYRRARDQAASAIPGADLPPECPVTLDDLVADRPDIAALEQRFASPTSTGGH